MNMKFRALCIQLVLVFCALPLMAKESVDYYELAKTGTQQQIDAALMSNANLNSQVFGSNRETFLMLALQADRPYDIINTILKADSSPTVKAKDKRTPVMYAAQYSSDPAVVEAVISYGTFLGAGKKGRVTAKDAAGHTAFYYAKLNPVSAVYELLLTFAKDPEPNATPDAAPAQETQTQTEHKSEVASKGEMATTTYIPSLGEDEAEVSSVSTEDENPPAPETEPEVIETAAEEPEPTQSLEPAQSLEPTQEEVIEIASVTIVEEEPILEVSKEPEVTVAEPETEAEPEPVVEEEPQLTLAEPAVEAVITKTEESPYLYDYAVQPVIPAPQEQTRTQSARVNNPNQADENGVTLLMKAAKAGNDWDIQNLIASGADVNLRDKDGWSALMYAVRYQNSLSIVQALIQAGAHIRIRNKYNATPLLIAADYSQNPDIIALLLDGRSVAEDEVYKAFIMSITSNAGSDHIKQTKVQLFLDRGISVNRIWKGRTPLMYAAEYCDSTAVLNMLLEAGANTATRDADGKTAFDYAKQNRRLNHDDIYWTLNEGEGY